MLQQPGTTEAYRELHKDLSQARLKYQQTMDTLLGGPTITQIHVVDGLVTQNGDPLRKYFVCCAIVVLIHQSKGSTAAVCNNSGPCSETLLHNTSLHSKDSLIRATQFFFNGVFGVLVTG